MSDNVTIVEADRPSDNEALAWIVTIRKALENRKDSRGSRHDFDAGQFVECDACAAKPGMPAMCTGCLANRHVIGMLRRDLENKKP